MSSVENSTPATDLPLNQSENLWKESSKEIYRVNAGKERVLAGWLDGQMGEETDGWIDGGIGGIALGWEIKPQINSLTRQDTEFSLECKSYIMICDGLLPAYLSLERGYCYITMLYA